MWLVVFSFAFQLLLIKIDGIVFDMNNRLPKKAVSLSDKGRGNLKRWSKNNADTFLR
jgi:hypothetical protein